MGQKFFLNTNQIKSFISWRPEFKDALFEIGNETYTVEELTKKKM